jgi:RNA polymerase sigma-70 factor (ECF subfamily)
MTPAEALGAWQELRARLKPYVARRVPSASDVDDVLQEVLIRMHRNVDQLREQERFGSWVYRIAEHAIVDNLRTRARHPVISADAQGMLQTMTRTRPMPTRCCRL